MSTIHLTRPDPVFDLRQHGNAPALLTDAGALTYAALADLVEDRRRTLGDTRRLVLLEAAPEIDFVATYLAALAGHHPVLLAPAGAATSESWRSLRESYDPDVVVARDTLGRIEERRPGTRHQLHADLALLLSTSGSTGSPKLVRLSRDNIVSNAEAIADYLGLGPDDRAATTLPLHYCYGLSVLHSHLAVGASLWLTDVSVSEPAFLSGFDAAGATSFAGVPHTFELLEQCGFADQVPAGLRYVTQAGGAMSPERIRALAELGDREGFEMFVMYGQTEATARMAYLPPDLVASRPETIGVPIPGGEFRVDDGELVYSGPNVMLGYAASADDLALGRTVHELRTGDLAVQHDDGLFQVVGRRSRVAKLFGVRIDLDQVERILADAGIAARAVDAEDRLTVFARHGRDLRRALPLLRARLCLPAFAVAGHLVAEFPLTANGKTDYPALRTQAVASNRTSPTHPHTRAASAPAIRDLYAVVLGRPDATAEDTFVDLGGDSLSFVEVSTQLAHRLGHLPTGWQYLTPSQLADKARTRRRIWTSMEPSVLLRALAILIIVVSHTDLFIIMGGAHVLLAVAGFNLARFTLPVAGRTLRSRRLVTTTAAFAVPATLWIAAAGALSGDYRPATALYLNQVVGGDRWTPDWQFWFLDVLVWCYLALALVLLVGPVDRWQRHRPFTAALVVVGVGLAVRYALIGISAEGTEKYTAVLVIWCVALGWAAAEAHLVYQRLIVAALMLTGTWGFFPDEPERYALV
ncbi:MAG TPA: AMP-binding protein, partial [Nocardioides sp.]|nr:AMP-binding protein [Nocardioides sp.]